jgi:hypothetical protein
MKDRSLNEIAAEIKQDWGKRINKHTVPYVEALSKLNNVNEMYGANTGLDAVAYFLVNAQTWRGEVARRIKAELKFLLKNSKSR